ncbi:inner membrane complex protein 1d, putative (IMC1d) [Plasmodium malariae]|uniref:Inner membrane complex protein 1d, putative (IMC1d) n=1 Tax=Plasmodium malariae TaxID=5858 RepID=A0A1A8VNZ4_PLAMA|nr:inner membrane complex protein 1d, putative (IMC1d) [Plasmodium malariae]
MELLPQDSDEYNRNNNTEQLNEDGDFINQENDIHVSIIKPITKRTIYCANTKKINVFYKPVKFVEEINTYVKKGEEHLIKLYENLKELGQKKDDEVRLKNENTTLNKLISQNLFSHKNKKLEKNFKKNNNTELKLFAQKENVVPTIETVFIPKLEKNIEIVSSLKQNMDVDYTYLVPKPVVIPVEVPILKFKNNFKIVPIRKKIIPVIKYTDELINPHHTRSSGSGGNNSSNSINNETTK